MYNEEFLKKIVNMGTLGYGLNKIISVLDIPAEDQKQFAKDFDNPKSEIAQAYQKGIDKADFAIDIRLFELAKSGDLKAIQKYEERKRKQQIDEMRDKRDRKYRR